MFRLLGGLFSLFALSAIAVVAGIGIVVWMYDRDLPSGEALAEYEPATLSRVYDGDGDLIAEYARERRIFAPIEEIPPLVKSAFISAEDKNFYSHPGIDMLGVARAMVSNLQALRDGGGRLQGASTITQQVMKNFLLSDDYSLERKIKEAILSVRIEQALSKDRILELYLNEIFLGQNAYGVAAAAQRYFGKTLEQVTLAEAAYLAALPKAPSDLHPVRNRARAVERRDYVLREMRENGYISAEEMAAAQAAPLETLMDGALSPQIAQAPYPDYFADEVRRQLTRSMGEAALFTGGLTVRGTLDPAMQAIAASALRKGLEQWDRNSGYAGPLARIDVTVLENWRAALAATPDLPRDVPGWRAALVRAVDAEGATIGVEHGPDEARLSLARERSWARPRLGEGRLGPAPRAAADLWAVGDVVMVSEEESGWRLRQTPELQGAFMAMDAHTGRVLAMQGGYSHLASVFNRATQARRQPGSAFKPFVYAAALERGYPPNTIIYDLPIVIRRDGQVWKPKNSSGGFLGAATMRTGLERSRNLMTIRLAQEVGLDVISGFAGRLGIYDHMPALLSYALGAGETTLYQLMSAYAQFANGGRKVEPTLVDRVQDRRGRTIYRHDQRRCAGCAQPAPPRIEAMKDFTVDPVTAYQLTSMLRGVVTRGTASRAFSGVRVPVAGKTGTTNDAKDVWFMGYTTDIVVGCFIGYDNPRPLPKGAFGGTVCAPVARDFIAQVYADGRAAPDFRPPSDAVIAAAGGVNEVFRQGDAIDTPAIIGGGDVVLAGGEEFPLDMVAGDGAYVDEGDGAQSDPGRPRAPSLGGDLSAPGGLY